MIYPIYSVHNLLAYRQYDPYYLTIENEMMMMMKKEEKKKMILHDSDKRDSVHLLLSTIFSLSEKPICMP